MKALGRRSWSIFFQIHWRLFILTILTWYPAVGQYFESIVWSSLNPKLHFSKDDFHENKAFLLKPVTLQSNLLIICPSTAFIPHHVRKQSMQGLYENLWMVNREDFYSCRINTLSRDNQLLHLCNSMDKLSYYNFNITKVYNTLGYKSIQEESRSIYLIATSNGSQESLNQTSGGHCSSENYGISMRIKFTVCTSKSLDPSCQTVLSSPSNNTSTCNNQTLQVTASKKIISSEVLAICLGMALAVSFLFNMIFLLYLCVRRNRRTESSRTKEICQEPMKSLILEPPTKKKPGKVSAAL